MKICGNGFLVFDVVGETPTTAKGHQQRQVNRNTKLEINRFKFKIISKKTVYPK
jgi:hypothetical protein